MIELLMALLNIAACCCILFGGNSVKDPQATPLRAQTQTRQTETSQAQTQQTEEAPTQTAQTSGEELTVEQVELQRILDEQLSEQLRGASGSGALPIYETLSKQTIENGGTPPDIYVIPLQSSTDE